MSYVVFENKGEIDIRSISTFGVSVKETENPIGYFGTGLKYALAILLRTNHKITLHSGREVFKFGLKKTMIRSKEFEVVTMNDMELPFTTELGKNWEVWQAFREIYCNCLDEKGITENCWLLPMVKDGITRVIVEGAEFKKAYDSRDSIVLQIDEKTRLLDGSVQVFNKPSRYLYYRGVRVLRLDEESLFTYNVIDDLELTEDRTVKYEHTAIGMLPRTLSKLKDKSLIRNVLLASRDCFESCLNFDQLCYWGESVSDEFKEVLEHEYNANNDRLSHTAISFHKHVMNKRAAKHYQRVEITAIESIQLERCKVIAKRIYTDFDDYKIMVVKTLGQNTMALADANERTMVISRDCFAKGTKYLLSTMIEEYAHLKTGYGDRTRELQTWLFDNICTMIENHITNEPI